MHIISISVFYAVILSMKKTRVKEVELRDTGQLREMLNQNQEKDYKIESLSDQLREYKEQLEVQAQSWIIM